MYKVLNDDAIPHDAGIAIEYNIPQTSKRVDFLISGYDESDKSNVIIIELKQWDKLNAIGDDMRYENGKLITDFTKRAKTDQSLKGIKSMYKENPQKALAIADEIIKNTYRTLMTRGMKGCYVYCVDEGFGIIY